MSRGEGRVRTQRAARSHSAAQPIRTSLARPEVVEDWADWARLRSATKAFGDALDRRRERVRRVAHAKADVHCERALANAANAAQALLAALDGLYPPPDEVFQVERRAWR